MQVCNEYRYGFQGQERDDEVKGSGNSYNYTFRMHDSRLGRFFAVDPLYAKYPHYSPYSFSGNHVISSIELEGLEEFLVIRQYSDGIFVKQKLLRLPKYDFLQNKARSLRHQNSGALLLEFDLNDPEQRELALNLEYADEQINGINNEQFSSIIDEDGNFLKGEFFEEGEESAAYTDLFNKIRKKKYEENANHYVENKKQQYTIYYDNNESGLTDEDKENLDKLAEAMTRDDNKVLTLKIEGHTSKKASADYNEKLSKERAAKIKNYMVTQGVTSNRINFEYYGESNNADSSDSEDSSIHSEAAKSNRRSVVRTNIEQGSGLK